MNELFQNEESLSPRLRWMQRHYITIIDDGEDMPPGKRYRAKHGMASIATGSSEYEACVNACLVRKLRGWEGMP
jgi:hypothetical protein